MRRRLAALLAYAASTAAVSHAAELCYSEPVAFGAPAPDASTLFDCPTAGVHTIDQLASAGWRIGRLTPVVVGLPQNPQISTQLLLKRSAARIFADGFDP